MTGRRAPLEDLTGQLRAGTSGGVVLHGPAGVGKTRLAEEAIRLAERSGWVTARAVGHPSTAAIPLGALAHLLPASLVRDLGVGEDERIALFHGARAELGRLAEAGPLVLLVDDVDLLDETSLAVLVPLVVSRTIFLLGTVRTGRSAPPRLSGLYRDGHLGRVDLEPLGRDELADLLAKVLDGPVVDAAVDELSRLSGGNLQVLAELVGAARQRGALVLGDAGWDLQGPLPTTAALDELVAEHVAAADADGRAVLELLAVCERFGLADLERVHGAATLEALEAGGLVTVVTEGRRQTLRLAHPLYGEVLRAQLPPLRLRRIHHELADIVEQHGARRRDDAVPVALWRVRSGGRVAAGQLIGAARLALAARDSGLAVDLVSAADDPVLEGERAEVLAEAFAMRGDAAAVERAVAGVWERPLAERTRANLARRLAETRFYDGRDLEGALAVYADARRRLRDADEIATIEARRATLLAGAGRPSEALAIAEAVGTPANRHTRVQLAAAVATSLLSLGRCDEAASLSRQATADHADLPDWLARRGIAQHVVNEAHALAYAGHYRPARALLEPAAERARATNAMGAWLWFEMALAEIARDTGRGLEAVRRFQAVADAASSAGQEAALVWAHVGVAQGHLVLGDWTAAEEALARADAVGTSPVATSVATKERTRAWLEAARGDVMAARARITAVADRVRADEVFIFEATLRHDLVRLGAPKEVLARLQELARRVDGPLVRINAAHAAALVRHDVELLSQVVDDYDAIDALGLAAEAAVELADLYRARAEARQAAAAQWRADELVQRAGGVRTPPLAHGTGVEPLTAREREVALLAAAGHTSRDIADRLNVSTRTVETHLARVFRKLGITSRGQLPATLGTAQRPGRS